MATRGAASPWVAFSRFVAGVLGASALLALVGYLPAQKLGGEAGVTAMLGAIAAAALGSLIGGLPVVVARVAGTPGPQVVMISMTVRLIAVALIAALIALSLDLEMTPFLLWLAIAYLLLLVIDTLFAMSVMSDPGDGGGGD